MIHYYYSRWTFNSDIHGLEPGTYHSTFETTCNMKAMMLSCTGDASEMFIKEFPSKEEMEIYWASQQPKKMEPNPDPRGA